jgi:chemotaxis signal transduction protein
MISLEGDVSTEGLPAEFKQPEERFILTEVGEAAMVFPAALIGEIILIERSQILPLPFYQPPLTGVIRQGGQIMPLLSMRSLLGLSTSLTSEMLTVIRLGQLAGEQAGVGLIVDKVVGDRTRRQLPSELISTPLPLDSDRSTTKIRLFQLALLDEHLWQPQRWQP